MKIESLKVSFVLLFLTTLLVSTKANAAEDFLGLKGNAYIGLDHISSEVDHTYEGNPNNDPDRSRLEKRSHKGYGVNLGYKVAKSNIFIAPEVFYEYLNNTARDFYHDSAASGDNLEVKTRRGAKLNLGYTFFDKLDVSVNYGFAAARFRQNIASYSDFYSFRKAGRIYGVSVAYEIYKNLDLRLAYDMHKIDPMYDRNYTNDGDKRDHIAIQTAKIGLVYNF